MVTLMHIYDVLSIVYFMKGEIFMVMGKEKRERERERENGLM